MANRVYGYQGYSGYQFETSPKKLQPEYEPEKHEHKVKTNKKVKTQIQNPRANQNRVSKEDFNKKVKFICYILFGFTVLFTISYRNSIINEKFNDMANNRNTVPVNISSNKYLILIFCLQYLHFPPKNI